MPKSSYPKAKAGSSRSNRILLVIFPVIASMENLFPVAVKD